MKFIIAKMVFLLIIWGILSLPMYSQPAKTIGNAVKAKLVNYRLSTTATITVKRVDVIATDDIVTLKVSLSYTNTGKYSETWEFFNTALVDAKGRQYTGMSWYIAKSWNSFRDFIRQIQPQMTENTFVFFKVPLAAFDGDISFCFVSQSNNKPQCPIKIYEAKVSRKDFVKGASFTSEVWK